MNAKTKYHDRQRLLMQAFDFSDDDLQANHNGTFSRRQLVDLIQKGNRSLVQAISLEIVGFVVITVLALLSAVPILIIFNLLLMIPLMIGIHNYRHYHAIAKAMTVESVHGLVIIQDGFLTINDMLFPLKLGQYPYIKHLEPHVVYYLPKSKKILSIEALSS